MVLGPGFDLGQATGRIILDGSGAAAGVREAQNAFTSGIDEISKSVAGLGKQMSTIGQSMTVLTAPLLGGLGFGIKAAAEFDTAMREISARTGIVGEDLQQIADYAIEMGAATVFSSKQAADAFLMLLTTGQSAEEAIETLPTVLNLAAAANMDLGRSADIVTDVMAIWGLAVEDAAMVADSLARASASSSANVGELGDAMRSVGGQARQVGLDVDQTAAIFAIFAERGLKGSEAGTQLRSMLRQMTADTDTAKKAWAELGTSMFDAEGNVRDLDVVLGEMREALADMSAEDQIRIMQALAGSYGVLGLDALLAGQSIAEMQEIMSRQVDAATVAEQQMQSFQNQLNSLIGSFEALAITVLTPFIEEVLKPFVEEGIRLVNMVTAWAKENPELAATITKVLAVVAVLGPVLVAVGAAMQALAPIIALVGGLMGVLLTPVGLLIAGVALLGLAWATNWNGIRDKVNEVVPKIEGVLRTLRLTIEEQLINGLPQIFGTNNTPFDQVRIIIQDKLITAFGDFTVEGIARNVRLTIEEQLINEFPNVFGTNNTPFDQVRIIVQDKLITAFGDFTVEGIARNVRLTIEEQLINEFPNVFGTNNTPFDQVRIIVQDKLITAFGDFELSKIDTTNVKTWADENANAILNAVVSVVGIVLGGPVGAVIGAAKLIATAIETDFLGFGTFIEESGIGAAVQSGVETLRGLIEGAFESLFGGGGEDPAARVRETLAGFAEVEAAPAEGGPLAQTIQRLVNGLKRGIELFTPELQESMQQIVSGISGFIDELGKADTSGLEAVVAAVLDVIGVVGGIASAILLIGIDIISDIFENVFPKIGAGISALISLVSAIGNGDPDAALTAISNGLSAFIGAITGAVAGFADPLINAINDLTGGNLPKVSELFDKAKEAIQGVWDKVVEVVQPILDEIQRLVNWFKDDEDGFQSVVNWIYETFILAIADLVSTITGIWDSIKGAIESLKTNLKSGFDWIINNVITPVKNALQSVIDMINTITGYDPNNFEWPEGTAPTAPGQPILPNRDSGGRGLAGMPVVIGTGAQPELFVPETNGQFIPNADELFGARVHVGQMIIQPQINPMAGPVDEQAREFGQLILAELDAL